MKIGIVSWRRQLNRARDLKYRRELLDFLRHDTELKKLRREFFENIEPNENLHLYKILQVREDLNRHGWRGGGGE